MPSLLRSRELVRYNLAAAHINLFIVRQGNKPIAGVKYVTAISRECVHIIK